MVRRVKLRSPTCRDIDRKSKKSDNALLDGRSPDALLVRSANRQGLEMTQLNNAMEIFKILPRTNCRDCRVTTCFAFAAAVFKGEKRLADCLHIDKDALETFSVGNSDSRTLEREEIQALKHLSQKISSVDLASSAETVGGLIF